eukprot:TRINITY_DN5613_c5_g1_i1.p3 TRINITY_DN5613_c5_g1~~TRINITY_DN5613_c5_g1_i1.p3  ORF type:complete len:125 (-),score=14.45 TRINITY_DN5613_c5_g1_i1:229-603(-)
MNNDTHKNPARPKTRNITGQDNDGQIKSATSCPALPPAMRSAKERDLRDDETLCEIQVYVAGQQNPSHIPIHTRAARRNTIPCIAKEGVNNVNVHHPVKAMTSTFPGPYFSDKGPAATCVKMYP